MTTLGLSFDPFASHGGLLIPLDMFRISMLGSVLGETLVSKARNILDAKLVLTRHPQSQLVLGRIEGSVIGDDVVAFWRDNADLALALSQVVPRQVFMYYTCPGPGNERREGFLVAQRGEVLAADEATVESIPKEAGPEAWPVSRLCEQMGVTLDELARGFSGGPSVEVSLIEPRIDDQAALMTLAGQDAEEPDAADNSKNPPDDEPIDDGRRRAAAQAAEEEATKARANEVSAGLKFARDELGIVVSPDAELGEPEILAPFVVASIAGDLPNGVPRDLTGELQGQRIDFAVRVEFLSEVFVDNKPLARSVFDERATEMKLGNNTVRVFEVLAPRLGYGTLVARERDYVFVSRRTDLPIPGELIDSLLAG